MCTEGQGVLLGKVFIVQVSLTIRNVRLLEEVVNEVRPAFPSLGWPVSALDPGYRLWLLVNPLSPGDLKTPSIVKKAAILPKPDEPSESHVQLEGVEMLSDFLTPEELETNSKHIHLVLQVPKSKISKSSKGKLPTISNL